MFFNAYGRLWAFTKPPNLFYFFFFILFNFNWYPLLKYCLGLCVSHTFDLKVSSDRYCFVIYISSRHRMAKQGQGHATLGDNGSSLSLDVYRKNR